MLLLIIAIALFVVLDLVMLIVFIGGASDW